MLVACSFILFLTENSYSKKNAFEPGLSELGSLGVFKVNNPYPSGSIVSFFVGESRTFNISNNNYQRVEWYLDDVGIKNDSKSIEIIGKISGNHTLMVKVYNASQIDSRIWKIQIYDDQKQVKFVFDTGLVIFWVIFIIIIIIMGLLITLLIKEFKHNKRSIKLDLRVIGEDHSEKSLIKKGDMSSRFNIPRS